MERFVGVQCSDNVLFDLLANKPENVLSFTSLFIKNKSILKGLSQMSISSLKHFLKLLLFSPLNFQTQSDYILLIVPERIQSDPRLIYFFHLYKTVLTNLISLKSWKVYCIERGSVNTNLLNWKKEFKNKNTWWKTNLGHRHFFKISTYDTMMKLGWNLNYAFLLPPF